MAVLPPPTNGAVNLLFALVPSQTLDGRVSEVDFVPKPLRGFELTINLPLNADGVVPAKGACMIFQWS
jgi:hypothetical protein